MKGLYNKNIRGLFYLIFCFIFSFVLIKDLLAIQAYHPNSHQDSCREYDIGEERILSVPFIDINIGYEPVFSRACRYKIKRQTDQTYIASIALEFSPSLLYFNGPVPKDRVHEHYLQKVKSCIVKANRKMIGPNGKRIFIHIEDAKLARKHKSSTPQHSIQIHTHYTTSSFKNFYSDIDCISIFHEILHYFCLVDEYRSQFDNIFSVALPYTENQKLFNCRVTQHNSMMSDDVSRKNRWSMALDNDPSWTHFSPSLHFQQQEDPIALNEDLRHSLLDPTYFNAIIYGNCLIRDDVRQYRECSRLAYQSSSFDFDCLSQKYACEQLNLLGRDKDRELARLYAESYRLQSHLGSATEDLVENLRVSSPYDVSGYLSIVRNRRGASEHAHLLRLKDRYMEQIEELERRIRNVENWPDQ